MLDYLDDEANEWARYNYFPRDPEPDQKYARLADVMTQAITPDLTPAPTPLPPPQVGGGGMSEEEGRAYDRRNGLIGGYMTPQGWVSGSPGTTGGGYTGDGGGGTLSSASTWQPFDAPDYQPPRAFTPPPAFAYESFRAPTAEDMRNEPGLQFRMDQGRKALESSAASRGTLRTGGTLKSILEYGQNFAEGAYGNVFDRALTTYGTNRGNAADIWEKAYRTSLDTADRDADQALTRYNTDFQSKKAEYMSEWDKYLADLDVAKYLSSP